MIQPNMPLGLVGLECLDYLNSMSIRPILIHPDPRLKKKCAELPGVDADLRRLADDMLETMYDAPGVDEITRPAVVRMRYLDVDGKEHEDEFDGLGATCVQHELDHLNGKLFIDFLSVARRGLITGKMKKLKRERARD